MVQDVGIRMVVRKRKARKIDAGMVEVASVAWRAFESMRCYAEKDLGDPERLTLWFPNFKLVQSFSRNSSGCPLAVFGGEPVSKLKAYVHSNTTPRRWNIGESRMRRMEEMEDHNPPVIQ